MIIVINGPLGCGKTTASWALMEALAPAVMLDGDYLAAYEPFDCSRTDELAEAYEIFALLIQHHLGREKEHFVLNWIFETPEQLQLLMQKLMPTGQNILSVRLDADESALEQRIEQRNNHSQLSWELKRGPELKKTLANAAQRGDMGHRIDTTHMDPDEVVEAVLSLVLPTW